MLYQEYEEKYEAIKLINRDEYKKKRWEEFQRNQTTISSETISSDMSLSEIKEVIKKAEAEHHEKVKSEFKEIYEKYTMERYKILCEFKKALAEEYLNNPQHPKADALWELAWEEGHSYGFHDVECEYNTMSILLD